MDNFCIIGKEHFIAKLEIFGRCQNNVYKYKQKISNPSMYSVAYCLHLQNLLYTFPCIHTYELKLQTINDQSSQSQSTLRNWQC